MMLAEACVLKRRQPDGLDVCLLLNVAMHAPGGSNSESDGGVDRPRSPSSMPILALFMSKRTLAWAGGVRHPSHLENVACCMRFTDWVSVCSSTQQARCTNSAVAHGHPMITAERYGLTIDVATLLRRVGVPLSFGDAMLLFTDGSRVACPDEATWIETELEDGATQRERASTACMRRLQAYGFAALNTHPHAVRLLEGLRLKHRFYALTAVAVEEYGQRCADADGWQRPGGLMKAARYLRGRIAEDPAIRASQCVSDAAHFIAERLQLWEDGRFVINQPPAFKINNGQIDSEIRMFRNIFNVRWGAHKRKKVAPHHQRDILQFLAVTRGVRCPSDAAVEIVRARANSVAREERSARLAYHADQW